MNEAATIREILDRARTIAVVGLTNREGRASLGVSRFMQSRGYRIVPVNPRIESALGEKSIPHSTRRSRPFPALHSSMSFALPRMCRKS